MELTELKRLFDDTDYIRRSGAEGKLRAAEYLKARCEALGAGARTAPPLSDSRVYR